MKCCHFYQPCATLFYFVFFFYRSSCFVLFFFGSLFMPYYLAVKPVHGCTFLNRYNIANKPFVQSHFIEAFSLCMDLCSKVLGNMTATQLVFIFVIMEIKISMRIEQSVNDRKRQKEKN